MNSPQLSEPLFLPCGVKLKNRLAKSAMSENMGNESHQSESSFERVYERWAQGNIGLCLTGNVMVDSQHLGEPNNVVIEKNFQGMETLKKWAQAGTQNHTHLWMQINHPGKQSPNFLNKVPVAPSAVPYESSLSKMFNPPRALTEAEIMDIIERFVLTAKKAKEAGFTGVQIHGAHGYLVSQFLSPRHNIRTDQWGGCLENRMRFVMSIYHGMRKELGSTFPISIKLNSADFQKGGFSEEDSIQVAKALSEAGMDLIEISGGTYEAPLMMDGKLRNQTPLKESTQIREAYFLDFCEKIRAVVKTPLMLTGGFRSRDGMVQALQSGACDMIGLGRSLVLNPEFAQQILRNENAISQVQPLTTGFKSLDKIFPLEIIWYTEQIHRMGKGLSPNTKASVMGAVFKSVVKMGWQGLKRVRA